MSSSSDAPTRTIDLRDGIQPRLLGSSLADITFDRRADGGYDSTQVDHTISRFVDALRSVDRERTALRAEVLQLRSELARERGEDHEEPVLDAVGLLSQTQAMADRLVLDAQQTATDLVREAEGQAREIVQQAEADRAERERQEQAVGVQSVRADQEHLELVRTYAKVAQVQLQTVIDSLVAQVGRLEELPDPHQLPETQVEPGPVTPAPLAFRPAASD